MAAKAGCVGRGLFPADMMSGSAAARSRAPSRIVLPPYAPGMRIGLFGGTFDPAHAAHRAACMLALRRRCPGVRFVWIMGADNLRSFHRWQKWRGIAAMVPMAVVDRLGPSLYASASPAGQALARSRLPEAAARSLAACPPPAWIYLHGLKSPLSSTALRAARAGSQYSSSTVSALSPAGHKTDAKVPQDENYGTPGS